jgi:hypothetical protein
MYRSLQCDEWTPPPDLLDLLKDTSIRQRDRVELIIAYYAADHGGNSPPFQIIADVMGISKGNAYRYALELAQPWRGRAVRRDGQFWLVESQYTHPVIKRRFKRVLKTL